MAVLLFRPLKEVLTNNWVDDGIDVVGVIVTGEEVLCDEGFVQLLSVICLVADEFAHFFADD